MEPFRVLHIVTSMELGGIENFIMVNYRNIDRTRVQFDFLKHRDSHDFFDDEILDLGGKIYSVPPINPLRQKQYNQVVSNFFNEHKQMYSIVHSHINTYSAYPLRIAKDENVAVRIAHAHATTSKLDFKTPFRIYTKKTINKYVTDAFACSNEAGKWLFGNLPYTVIPNAIDSELYLPKDNIRKDVREELGITDKFVIGMVANFKSVKNHKFMIEVFSDVLKRIPNACLVLVGHGEMKQSIEKMVAEKNLSNRVIFTGLRKDVSRILQGLDVFVLPSISEGFPISVLEAEAVGVPCVISTGVPTDVKLFEAMDTFFVSIEDKNAWVDEIVSLQQTTRRSWAKEISKTQYDVKNNAKKLMEFYESKHRMCENLK
ncbi:MAG: glycosyltransferase [Clostridia bacterium]|nr:glycosyltransferase [Clostridia bacterium]